MLATAKLTRNGILLQLIINHDGSLLDKQKRQLLVVIVIINYHWGAHNKYIDISLCYTVMLVHSAHCCWQCWILIKAKDPVRVKLMSF